LNHYGCQIEKARACALGLLSFTPMPSRLLAVPPATG